MSNRDMRLHGDGMPGRWLVGLSGLVVLLHAWYVGAQDPAHAPEITAARVSHAARIAANPRGLSLDIRTHDGRLRFVQGEVITLDLEFRDASGEQYPFQAIAYDRSGRLAIDRPIVAPASGVEDPLQDYYRAMGFGFLGGGLSTPPAPLTGPRTLALDLNEWVRFVRPGTYAVSVESHRFLDPGAAVTQRHDPVAVVSNLLVIEITPPPPDVPLPTTLSARALRFADSPAAARELARRLVDATEPTAGVGTDGFDLHFGLLGTRHRAEALAALRAGLGAASRAVTDAVPQVAAFLDVMTAMPREMNGQDVVAEESAERVRERMARHACRLAFWQRAALAAGLRGGPGDVARASVSFANDAPPHCPPLPPVNIAHLLAPVFDQLPSAQQRLMLSHRWGQVVGPWMLPALRRLVSPEAQADPETRDVALVRFGELAPGEAARASRDDVLSGRFRFSARSLRVRPEDMPAVTQALATHLAGARDASTPLADLQDGQGASDRGLLPALAHLGTRREFEVLGEWRQGEQAPCAARASVIAFALAVDRDRGERLLRAALSDSRSRCGEDLLNTLARSWPQRLRETIVIEALWHERHRVAASAAGALARIGTGDARQALWRRLDEWHARWAGREDDLRLVTSHVDDPVSQELELGRALREALLRGRGWLTTAEDRLRVRESCVTAACREEFSPFRGGPPVRLVLVQAEEWTGETVYRVDGHAFHSVAHAIDRLARYPKAVTIAWQAGNSHAPTRAAALYVALAAAGLPRGVRLLAQPPPVVAAPPVPRSPGAPAMRR